MTSPFTALIEALEREATAHSINCDDAALITESAMRVDAAMREAKLLECLREPDVKVYDRSAHDRCVHAAIEAIDLAVGGDIEDAIAATRMLEAARRNLQAAERL